MPKSGYRVSSVMICDDARREDNGKELLIGVYTRDIIVKALPAKLMLLTFRIVVEAQRGNFENCHFSVASPSKKEVVSGTLKPTISTGDQPSVFVLTLGQLEFREAGDYTIKFGLDQKPRPIGKFGVRLPVTTIEKQRVGIN